MRYASSIGSRWTQRGPRQDADVRGRRSRGENDQARHQRCLRGAYEDVQKAARGKLRRFDYPSSGPHSTQEWVNHRPQLQAIFAMSPEERRALAEDLWQIIVDLPEHARRTAVPRSGVAPFVEVLGSFRPAGAGIPSGAVLQGLTYGYMPRSSPITHAW